jgi:hypothetical protein
LRDIAFDQSQSFSSMSVRHMLQRSILTGREDRTLAALLVRTGHFGRGEASGSTEFTPNQLFSWRALRQ